MTAGRLWRRFFYFVAICGDIPHDLAKRGGGVLKWEAERWVGV